MADVVPFLCIRPCEDMAQEVAALPYDVFNLSEARAEIALHPHSFLRIDMAESTLPDSVKKHDNIVYERARELLDEAINDGTYCTDSKPHYYLYRLTTAEGRSQTGVVGCSAIDDYEQDVIKKHEKTRAEKETDRIRHVDTCSAQTGPIFLTYRSDGTIEDVMAKVIKQAPLYDFEADDGVSHTVWRVDDSADEAVIRCVFAASPALYIADGHHRAASAVKAGLMRRSQAQSALNGEDQVCPTLESDHFLSVIFPSNQLTILDYNRVITDLNGLNEDEFFDQIGRCFDVSGPHEEPCKPRHKGAFGMYFQGAWYELAIKDSFCSNDPVAGLDVAILQDNLLAPILGIADPRTDKRIDFVGGIRGLRELERRVDEGEMVVAFALYPPSLEELFSVADAGLLMPPKSTWFEPKPRSGLFIHRI